MLNDARRTLSDESGNALCVPCLIINKWIKLLGLTGISHCSRARGHFTGSSVSIDHSSVCLRAGVTLLNASSGPSQISCNIPISFVFVPCIYTLSGRLGKVVASHVAVARSIAPEVALIYTMHEAIRGTAHEGGGCDQSIGLPSLMTLPVAGCGWLQLGVPHWAASVHYCK